ncbi:MAG: RNA 3'-terminal phosphate cyclase [Desulfovibrio sp.]
MSKKSSVKDEHILIDGSLGEGGGQVLRASLALSMALGRPFRMVNIRANRPKPGLKRQHLTCVQAAQAICGAHVEGDAINATELSFAPGKVRPGDYTFHIGTGGSIALVLQALMPALLWGETPSRLTVTGGTHVPFAPPFEFMRDTLFPRLELLGPRLAAHMETIGYMDTGGGSVTVDICPAAHAAPFHQEEAGDRYRMEAVIYGHSLPEGIVERETAVLLSAKYAALGLTPTDIQRLDDPKSSRSVAGPGNMVLLTVSHGLHKTVFGECGWRGRSAETVARQACKRARIFISAGMPIEAHLADQLLVPLALAGGGSFVAERATKHTRTCLAVIEQFMDIKTDFVPIETKGTRITLR